MIGLFFFGCFVTGVVAAACFIVVTGIREDRRDRERIAADPAHADVKVGDSI
jgi:hypothetical protein